MILRIYKTHDHDLMSLHQTGALNIPKAAKAAVIAYFKGEQFRFELRMDKRPDSKAMPTVAAFQIEFDDILDGAPGIQEWLDTFEDGYRNCCIKAILRFYLADPCISMFRTDGWQPGFSVELEGKGIAASVLVDGKRGFVQRKKQRSTVPVLKQRDTNRSVVTTAENRKEQLEVEDSSLQEKQIPKIQAPELETMEEDDEFDAFTALFELRKGTDDV